MALALPLLIPFAEAAGITISAIATAAGIDKLSDKVEEYIEDNPENAQKIFAMIMPEQGLASILKNESSEGDEEVSETEIEVAVEEKPKLTGKEKGMRMRQAALQKKGNYSSPDAEGNYESKRGRMIRTAEELGLADPELKDNYKKSNFDYKKYFRKADGGMMEYANGGGVGSMMQRKSFKGGGMDMGNESNQKQSASTGSTKSSTNKGPAGGQSTGGNYNGGSNNPIVNRIITQNKPDKSPFAKFVNHDTFTDTIKLAGTPNYHQLGGFDFMKRFPSTNPSLAKGLATGYQYLSEGAKALANEDVSFADAMKRAKEETRLNSIGIDDFTNPESVTYKQYQDLVPETGKVVFANGGGVGSMMQRKNFRYGGDTMGGKNDKSKTSKGPDRSAVGPGSTYANNVANQNDGGGGITNTINNINEPTIFDKVKNTVNKVVDNPLTKFIDPRSKLALAMGGYKYLRDGVTPFQQQSIDEELENIKTKGGIVPYADGGRVNYNQGSNWWDTLDPQGMNVYNSMKRGGHDDATIQSQLAMLGYYDPNTTPPDSTPDVPNIINQNINQGGGGGGGITATGPGLGYTSQFDPKTQNKSYLEDIGEGTIDDDDLSFGLSLKEGIFGLQRMLGNIPTPLNLALKAADKFKNYRADKKTEAAQVAQAVKDAAEKQAALDAINASMANDQRINNQQDWTGGSDNYSGGMDNNTGNYNDPYDSGYAD